MTHGTSLIATVAIGFLVALAGGFAAARLRLPPLVGYLLAGVVVGPFTPGFVADAEITPQLAEIGVVFLMFGVGMHFSLADLLAVRRVALPGALAQIVVVTGIGLALAHGWGWSLEAGLVLGAALAVSSTVVLLRALAEDDALPEGTHRLAVGWLVIEDLFTVLLLVLLPALAAARGAAAAPPLPELAAALGLTLLKVGGFIGAMMLVGARLLPWVLDQVARTGSRELFTLAAVAIGLGIGFGSAELLGLSFALGAFFAGVVVNQSDHSHRAAAVTEPLEDVFAVLFFVSAGMLFDPAVLLRDPLGVAAVLAVILAVKALLAYAALRLLGEGRPLALTLAAGFAQVGEFSFLLVGLGRELGMLPPGGRDVVLAAALLAITVNPFALRLAARLRRR